MKVRSAVLLLVLLFIQAQGVSFEDIQKRFQLPQSSQKVIHHYLEQKMTKHVVSPSKLYVTLYEYLNTENITEQQKNALIKAVAYIAVGADEKALNAKINEIKRGLGKLNVLTTQEGIEDIGALR